MMRIACWLLALGVPLQALGQEPQVREQLIARGAPADFADRVAEIVNAARADGLPTDPLATKAMEGWAKRAMVPPARVLVVLEGLSANLHAGRVACVDAGLDPPPKAVVSAAGEALGRGLTSEDVATLIRATSAPDEAATGLVVASSLAAQGLSGSAAVKAVRDVYRKGGGTTAVLELPSAVAALVARGVPMSDVARQIHEGRGLPLPSARGLGLQQGRPGTVPPGRGPPMEPPGQGKPNNPGETGKPPGS